MLILTRNIGKRIYIGDDIIIQVIGIQGCPVRIGIEAPRNIPVHREEIIELLKDNPDALQTRS